MVARAEGFFAKNAKSAKRNEAAREHKEEKHGKIQYGVRRRSGE